jgi:hypothetical protein
VSRSPRRSAAGLEKLSRKAAVELLDHPGLAGLTAVTLTESLFAALSDRTRRWRKLDLRATTSLSAGLLARAPEVEDLTLVLEGDPQRVDETLLAPLTHLTRLVLRLERAPNAARGSLLLRLPATLDSLSLSAPIHARYLAEAARLRELSLSGDLSELASLAPHLSGVRALNLRGRKKISLPRGILSHLRSIESLWVHYVELPRQELAELTSLKFLSALDMRVDDVPALPQLATFEGRVPRDATALADLLERCPGLREVRFAWDASTELTLNEPDRWARLRAILESSRLELFAEQGGPELRREGGFWSVLSIPDRHAHWFTLHLAVQLLDTFGALRIEANPEHVASITQLRDAGA